MKNKLYFLLIVFLFGYSSYTRSQIISTIAGNGTAGFSGDGGLADTAELYNPSNITIDINGNIYFVDQGNNRVRKINDSGIITTIAGTDTPGFSGDNGPATLAQLATPCGIAVDDSNNIYIADDLNNRIRKINSAGIITTIAGTGVLGFSGDGGPATAAELASPHGIALDNKGNLFFCDVSTGHVRKIDSLGIITTIAGTGSSGYNGDNILATLAELNIPIDIASDFAGNLYISDNGNSRLRKIDTTGIITTVAGNGTAGFTGDGGMATSAELDGPWSSAIDKFGNIYISDEGNYRTRKINASGIISTFAGNGIEGYSGDGIPAIAAEISGQIGVALDSCGYLYLADNWNNRIRKVTSPYCNYELVPNVTALQAIALYPNPAIAILTITASDKITNIAITNLLGQTVYNQEYNNEQVQVNVAGLPPGVYFIQINETEARKFVKE